MEIRFMKQEAHVNDGLADHARQELMFRLMHRSDRVAHVTVRLGATAGRSARHDTYCLMHLQLRDMPAATVVNIGSDAHDTIDRAADRVGRLAEEQLRLAGPAPAGGPDPDRLRGVRSPLMRARLSNSRSPTQRIMNMTEPDFRRYPRNSPQAAARIVAAALLANGGIKAAEWQGLVDGNAFERLGVQDLGWHAVIDDLCQDLLSGACPGRHCVIDAAKLAAWLGEVDDVDLQALIIDVCARVIEADGEVHPGELLVLRAALEHWVLPMEDEVRVERLIYGLGFEVTARHGLSACP